MASEAKQFREYKRKLQALGADILPRVVAETINTVASFAHADSIRNVRSRFVNRNAYTERSLKYYKATPKSNWLKINAVTGSISPYMDEQDAGGYRLPKSGSAAPVATLAARGGNARRVVTRKNRAGQLGENQFVGNAKGQAGRPVGVYERRNKNRRLVLIRDLSLPKVQIKETKWHRDAMTNRATQSAMYAEFIRQAKIELQKIQK